MISPAAATVSADLAEAALASPAFAQATKLASWVGQDRELTASGVPRPAAAAEACRTLGIPLPRARLRSALDVGEFMAAWAVAVQAGLVVTDGRRAWASPDIPKADDPRAVLDAWVKAAAGSLGVPGDPCAGCLIVLHELQAADGPVDLDDLATALATAGEDATGEPCPDCGEVHDQAELFTLDFLLAGGMLDEPGDWEHAEGTVTGLTAFGAATTATTATTADGAVELTPLGSMLATAVFEGCAPAPDAAAESLVSVVTELPPPVAAIMAGPWLAARSPDAAVHELLAVAEAASGNQRAAALAMAREAGAGAMSAWRSWAGRPGFGAYARQWLAEQGQPAAARPQDDAWLAVDSLSIMLDELGEMLPPFVLAAAVREQLGGDVAEVLELFRGSGHPAAAGLAARLTGLTAVPGPPRRARKKQRRAGPAAEGTCQLRITLRDVSKPPVWRRVVVPAGFTLAELHDVIMLCMGWHDEHLHMFGTSSGDYGPPGLDLGFADESAARVADVLSAVGDTLRYSYDFGDGWEHEIRLEETRPAEPGGAHPSCVAGRGACPPEDCGGPWGYANLKEILADPHHEEHADMLDWLGLESASQFDFGAFSVDAVNARLKSLG